MAAGAAGRTVRARLGPTSPPLPGRPSVQDPVAGPLPSAADPSQPAQQVRAICCSGGGIRAAAFSLGGLQVLGSTPDSRAGADGTQSSWYGNADFVTAVSGGSYIASAFATVQHGLDDSQRTMPPFAPGSPEDNRLRAHTRYLVDSNTQLSISILGILYGLLMNLVPILVCAYIIAKALGAILGRHALKLLQLSPDRTRWEMHYPAWLVVTIVAIFLVGLLGYTTYRVADVYHPFGDRVTTVWCVVALCVMGAAVAAAGLFLATPWLMQQISRAPGKITAIPVGGQSATFFGTVAALLTIVQQVIRRYRPPSGSGGGTSGGLPSSVTAKFTDLGRRIGSALLPWLGSAIVVLLILIAMLTWTWNMAYGRHELTQWVLVACCLALLVLWQAGTDVNRNSLHRVYTQRLATAFAVTRSGIELDPPEQPLSCFTKATDKPALIVCATANTGQPGVVPSGRYCAPFTFSAYRSGISSGTMFQGDPRTRIEAAAEPEGNGRGVDLAHREIGDPARVDWMIAQGFDRPARAEGPGLTVATAEMELRATDMTLMDMVGVSSAAVSPAMGRMSRRSIRLLLGVANVRLGMWLPNPMHSRWSVNTRQLSGFWARVRWQIQQPGLVSLWREIVRGITLNGAWVYVTDGGHYENLGLVEALRRGATEIVVFDASGDTPFTLGTFGEAVETARTDLGVEIALDDPDALGQAGSSGLATRLAARCTATYANGVKAKIYLCKAAMVDGLPADLISWHLGHPDFPNTSTADQLYGDREFEAYRRLGQAAAEQAIGLITTPQTAPATPAPSGQSGAARKTDAEPRHERRPGRRRHTIAGT